QSTTTKMFGLEDCSRILLRRTVALGLTIRHTLKGNNTVEQALQDWQSEGNAILKERSIP
ncbi:hypothetical protein, partial [Paenibacillus popilliae]|uniref:hypothetical protein n=1 Tax=Paenibacillus popilliae TaxID=78057 RepID=UPI001F3680F2